ncbi:MAG TPA: YciC family protein [Allosphingosinicella sp.]|nr:YciC family protein [Allosphingosinicella sp.]
MKFSYSEVWNDAVEMLRTNATIVIALAGVFLFLPGLLVAHFLPMPTTEAGFRELYRLMWEYFTANGLWIFLARLVAMVGEISLLILFLDARGRSVGTLIAAAVMILPFYFVASFLSGLMLAVGFALLIVPGLYLIGRLALVGPHIAAAGERNPIAAIRRSFEMTEGKGWAVLGLLMLVWIAGAVIAGVIGSLLGILFIAVAGQDVGALLTNIVNSITNAALQTVVIALVAALYMRLRAGSAAKVD